MRRRRAVHFYCTLYIILTYNFAYSESRESTACAAKTKSCSVHNLTCAGEEVITVTHAAYGYKRNCPKDHVFNDCAGQDITCCRWLDSDKIVKFSETLLSDLKRNCSSRSSCTIYTSELDRENSPSFTYTIIEYSCQESETVHIGAIIIGVLAAVNVIVIVMVIIVFLVIRRREKRSLYIPKPRAQENSTGEGPHYFTVESSVSLPRGSSPSYGEGAVGGASPTTTAIIHEQPKIRDITRSPKSTKNRQLPNRTMGGNSLRSNPASENLYSETTFTKKGKNKWNAAHDDKIEVMKPESGARENSPYHISKVIGRPRMSTPPATLENKPPLLKLKSDREFMDYCAKNNPSRNKSGRLITDRDENSNKPKLEVIKDRNSNGDKLELGVTKARDLNGDRWKLGLEKDRDFSGDNLKRGLGKDRDLNDDRWKPVINKFRDLNGDKWKPGIHLDSDLNNDRWKPGLSRDLARDRRKPELTKPRALNDFVAKDRDLDIDKSKREFSDVRGDRKTEELAFPKDIMRHNLTEDRELGDSESQKTDVTESSDGSFVEDIDAMLRQKGISVLNEKQRCILSSRIDRMNR